MKEPTMEDALAAGDGTLHGAIDYWRQRAWKAEKALFEQREQQWTPLNEDEEWLKEAMQLAYKYAVAWADSEAARTYDALEDHLRSKL